MWKFGVGDRRIRYALMSRFAALRQYTSSVNVLGATLLRGAACAHKAAYLRHYSQSKGALRRQQTHRKTAQNKLEASRPRKHTEHRWLAFTRVRHPENSRRQESGMEEAKHFIGNQWVAAASHETIP